MKNIMTKTALTTSLMLLSAGIASAQTTVSGNLALTYKAVSNDMTTQKTSNFRQFGKESQINIANKGKLNNGMDYAAGFSIELDGSDTMQANSAVAQSSNSLAGAFNENVYIDFIMGNTTISLGADHMQNPDFTITNLTGAFDQDDVIAGIAGQTATLYSPAKNSAYQAYGIGAFHNLPNNAGRVSFNYTPDRTTGAANGDTNGVNATNVNTLYDAGESAYEIGYRGSAGVKGLTLAAFLNKAKGGGAVDDTTGVMLAASYNFGQFTVAAERAEVQANTGVETNSMSYGIAYAISKDTSIGYNLTKTDSNERIGSRTSAGSSTVTRDQDEKIHGLSVAHSLGPVSVALAYGKVDSLNGVTNNDGEAIVFRTNVNF
jgi:hypothetical protein